MNMLKGDKMSAYRTKAYENYHWDKMKTKQEQKLKRLKKALDVAEKAYNKAYNKYHTFAKAYYDDLNEK